MAKFLRVILFLLIASAAFAGWDSAYFRGTPNGWGTTEMERAGRGKWKITVRFGEGDDKGGPRFKISRNDDNWDESYPNRDYKVDRNSTYEITFNERSKEIFVNKIKQVRYDEDDNDIHRGKAKWKDKLRENDDNDNDNNDDHNNRNHGWDRVYFRGTANGWGASEMDKVGKNLWRIRARFKKGQDGNSRFKISKNSNNWNEAYPNKDYQVENGFYEITFNDATKEITINRLSQREEDTAVDDERGGRKSGKIKTILEFKAELR